MQTDWKLTKKGLKATERHLEKTLKKLRREKPLSWVENEQKKHTGEFTLIRKVDAT